MTYEVCIDFDATDWSADPDFTQAYDTISGDVDADGAHFISWTRGKEREPGNAPAATLELHLKPGLCATYSPWTAGTLADKIRPWLPIRVRGIIGALDPIPVYFGYISRWTLSAHKNVQSVSLYCTDGTDLLARQLVTQDSSDKTLMSDGDAIDAILDAAGWNTTRRDIDKDGGDELLGYPSTYIY